MATDTKIILKRSDITTATPNLDYVQFGEFAFNYRDEKLYYRSYDIDGTTEIVKNYDFQRVVPVAKGGTGATTAPAARLNLGAAPLDSPSFTGIASLADSATQPTIALTTGAADGRRLATVAYVRAEIADDAPTKTGGGASGLWGIGVTGNAGTATKLATARTISQGTTSDINFSYTFDGSANITPNLTINSSRASTIQSALSLVPGTNIQAFDADLSAIAALTGTSGLLRKTATNTWSLDTETYTPTSRTVTVYTGNGIEGGSTTAQDLNASRSWTLGLTDTGVTAATYNDNSKALTPFTVDAKGRITAAGQPVTIAPLFASIDQKPTTLGGYGITDALDTSSTAQVKAGNLTAANFIKSGGTSSQFLKADGSSDGTPYTPTSTTLTISTDNGITGGTVAQTLASNRSWTFGLTGQASQLHNLVTDGFFVRSTVLGASSMVARSIAVGSGLSITNSDGVSGNPTITLATSNLTALRDLSTTGFLTRTGSNTLSAKSIAVSGVGLSITNADGVAAGNPTISSNATSANTASAIVARDASGNFTAGAITGTSFVVSNTSNAHTITLSGTPTANRTLTLPNKADPQTIATLTDIPDHSDGANTTIAAAPLRVISAITVNSLGHTTSVSSKDLAAADIPVLDASKITTGTFDTARITDATVTGKVLTGFTAALLPSIPMLSETDTILGAFQKLVPSISIKANTASPTFTGTVTLPTGSAAAAPLRFVSGTNLITTVSGAVEFNGTNLFITNSALSRKTIAYTDSNITGNASTATTATRLATARTISQGTTSDINFSYTFDGSANVTPNLTINSSRASQIRDSLGLTIGTNVQAYDPDLAAIAALADGIDEDTAIDIGYLRKTGENTWEIDQETTPPNLDEQTTISGDVIGASGLGSRAIENAVLATANTSPGTYNNSATAITPFTVDGKGRVTSTGSTVTITPAFLSITGRPTTLSGYGITDAQALNANLTSISTFTGTSSGILQRGSTGTWTLDSTSYTPIARTLTIAGAANSGVTVTPSTAQSLAADRSWSISLEAGNLTQLRDLGTTETGIIVHNGATGGGMLTRSIVSGNAAEITITNGNGVSGNPTISLTTSNLTSLRALTTNGFLAHTGTNTITPRSIAIASGSTGLSITNGDGVLGNPTLTLSSTSSAVNNSLVARDSSGNFAANTITANTFSGSLSGNATTSSTSAVVATDTTNATYGIIFASGTSSGETLRTDLTGLNYNPSTNTLSASTFNGGATLSGTPTAPTAAVSTNSTQIATTAFVLGQAADTTPLINGTASTGSSTRFARADHVHPTDTTRAPLASPTFTGTVTAGNTVNIGLANTTNTIVNIGGAVAANKQAFTNYIGDSTYTEFGLQIGRLWGNGTGNVTSAITHRGLGSLSLNAFDAGSIALGTNNTNRVFISSNGNVGIGTTSPSSLLHVNGAITTSADSFINSIRIGRGAGSNTYNTAIGTDALLSNTTGSDNTVMGYWSLDSNTTGSRNTAVGAFSMGQNSSGADNTAVGAYTLVSNTTGYANIALGNYSLNATTTGYNNVAIGNQSMITNTTGYANIAIGESALRSNTTENGTVAIGEQALKSNTSGFGNVAIGQIALSSNTTASSNTAVGWSSLSSNTTGGWNTAIGRNVLYLSTTGANNTAVGSNAMQSNTTGYSNVAVGTTSLLLNTVGYGNVALGENALRSNTSGYYNIAIGPEALRSNTTSSRNYKNIAIGADAMRYVSADYSYHNIAIGFNAIGNVNATYSQENIAIGVSALSGNNVNGLSSTQCVVIGNYAFQKAWGSGSSVVIGYSAGYNTYDGHSTVAIGNNALYSNTSGDQNTVIGQGALYSNTTGNRNVAIGANAGSGITTGGNNILIGVAACPSGTYTNSGCVVIAPGNAAGTSNTFPSSTSISDEVNIANGAGRVARFQGASASAWSWVSDARDKRNITDIDLGLEFINQLQPRKFEWNHRTGKSGNGEYAVGFIAQELLDVSNSNNASHAQLVSTDNPDQYTVSQTNLIPILVNAIKELSAELKSVKEELAKIK